MSELRVMFGEVDPLPPLVTEAAKAALGWRRLDAELAELLSDSAFEQESLALARGAEASARSLTFTAPQLTIDVEIREDEGARVLLGQLTPPATLTIEIQTVDERVLSVDSDQLGRFRASLPTPGPLRLRVVDPSRASGAAIETSWITA